MELVQTLDDYGKPAWITLMIVSFILFWPLGLGLLFYLIWSGRMGCRSRDWKGMAAKRWTRAQTAFKSSGNSAFDEYREETLRRLEEEAEEFKAFMERLRAARDKAEFDQFMAERTGERGRDAGNGGSTVPQAG
ncbi:MAG: DUF2852 domain-containing protein [Methyloligellaceae bacterium]